MFRKSNKGYLHSVLFFVLIVSVNGCRRQNQVDNPLTPVTVMPVTTYSGESGARYSASIVPYTQVNLAFKVGGYIESILQTKGPDGRWRNVQVGEFVKKGAVLAQIRKNDYEAAVNQASGSIAQAKAAHQQAVENFNRAASLYSSQSMTKSDYDSAKANLDATSGQMQQATGATESAQISLSDTSLRAPMDAVILQRSVEVGSFVGPGTVGFVISGTEWVKAIFGVPDFVVDQVKLGMPMKIRTESISGAAFNGQITAIAAAADQSSRVFNVEVTIPNPDNKLKVGMIATVDLRENTSSPISKTSINVVPLSAIVRAKDKPNAYSVFVVQNEGGKQIARSRAVEVGEVYGNKIAVQGVQIGESVIVTGATLVIDGQQVNVTP
jgi:RND family efflux transporter MFP subunit